MTPEQYQSIIEREFATDPEMTAYCAHTRALAEMAIEAGISPLIQNQYDQERFDQYGARISIASNIANYWHGSHNGALCALSRQSTMSDALREITEQDRYRYLADKIDTADFPLPYTRYWNSASDEQKLERIELYFRADGHFDQYHKIARNQLAELRHRAEIMLAIGCDPQIVQSIRSHADKLESAWNSHVAHWQAEMCSLESIVAERPFELARKVRPIDRSVRFNRKLLRTILPTSHELTGGNLYLAKRNAIPAVDDKRIQSTFDPDNRILKIDRAREIFAEAVHNRESARIIGEYDFAIDDTRVCVEPLDNPGQIVTFDPAILCYLLRITEADSVMLTMSPMPIAILNRSGNHVAIVAANCDAPFKPEFDIETAVQNLTTESAPV